MNQFKKLVLTFALLLSSLVYAEKIKVAYYPSQNFCEGTSDDQMKSGYGYEYLQILSAVTGWSYEYVYGSYSELYDQFCEGKIDLFPGLSITPEREKIALYPKIPMGTEVYYIFTDCKNSNLRNTSINTLNHKKIGTVRNTVFSNQLEEWEKENNIDVEEIIFDNIESVRQALKNGDIDALVNTNNNVNREENLVPIKMIGGSAFYLAVTNTRPDLYISVVKSLAGISEINPYFTQLLQQKYFSNSLISSYLTKEEADYLDSIESLKVGYIKNFRPFCDQNKDGSVFGLIEYVSTSLLKTIHAEENIAIEYYGFDNYSEMFDALKNKTVDFVFPVYDNLWFSENASIIQTTSLGAIDSNIIVREGFSVDQIKKVGVTKTNWFQGVYVSMNFPEYEFILFDSDEACLNAILKKEVDCSVFNIFRANYYLGRQKYRKLTGIPTSKPANLCLGIDAENVQLASILNRSIQVMGPEHIKDKLYEYSKMDEKFSLSEYLFDNMLMYSSIILFIVVGILGAINFYIYNMKKSKNALENQFEVLEALSRNYIFEFIINLAEQTCVLIKIDGHIVDKNDYHSDKVYPYEEMLNQYIINRVYKPDQEKLLNALSLDLVKEKLADSKEYNYNYRVFENEDVHSYQANFIRLKCKDGTEKVVLAFHNIDDIVAAAKERELLKIKSETDALTDLLNYKCCEEMVNEAVVEKKTGGMFLSMEIQNFEEINNKYGHAVGDSVLIFVADCIKKAFRAGDILSRVGGDDFAVLAFNIETEEAGRKVIERFFNRLENQNIPELKDIKVSTSVGAKIIKSDEITSFEKLQKITEISLQESKKYPGNMVIFS